MDKRICPNCGEPCEKEYETAFVHGQELCVCCNSNIEPCCEEDGFTDNILNDGGENNNVFVDFFYETGFLKSNWLKILSGKIKQGSRIDYHALTDFEWKQECWTLIGKRSNFCQFFWPNMDDYV